MNKPAFTAAALRGAVDLSAFNRPAGAAGRGSGTGAGPAPGAAGPGAAGAGAAGPGAAGAAGADGGLVVTATDATFQDVATASLRVPVVVVLWSSRLPQSASFVGVMADVARDNGGRIQVAAVDVDTNPGLLRAFQVQSVPATVGLVQGQPVPLFAGALSAVEVQPWIDELLKLAVQHGVTGRIAVAEQAPGDGPDGAAGGGDDDELPPLLQAAYDAIDRGDLTAAVAAYEQLLSDNPGDTEAALGLGQVRLLQRTQGVDFAAARAAAAADPTDVAAQCLVADLDVLGGHVEDAFVRLVDTVRATAGQDRNQARQHLLGLFEVVGSTDERVLKGRRALMSALF